MKLLFLSLAMSFMPLLGFAESYCKLWKQVKQFEEDGKPKSAYNVAERLLQKASRDHHAGQTLSARLKMAELRQEWAPDSFFADIQDIEDRRSLAIQPEAKAVYASLLAELYEMNRFRSQASGLKLTSNDMKEWTQEQYDSAATANWQLSMQNLSALSRAKSKDWMPFIEQQSFSAYFKHDLLHVLWSRIRNQRQDIWKDTKKDLASLAQEVSEVYKRMGNREAALLVSLDRVRLKKDESEEKNLRALKEEYADLPLCSEVYLRLMSIVGAEEAVKLGRECIAKYPKYNRIGEVRNLLNDYVKPYINWSGLAVYYPGKAYEWAIESRNARRLTFEVFRMPKDYGEIENRGDLKAALEQIRKRGQVVSSFSYDLPKGEVWSQYHDTIPWTAPNCGLYAMIITGEASEPEAEEKTRQQYTTFICSRLQPLYQSGLGQQRTIVVDAETGHPIEGATVEYFYTKADQKIPLGTITTNAEGRASLDESLITAAQTLRIESKVSYGDDIYLKPRSSYYTKNWQADGEDDMSKMLRLYSDRSIYRPGQTIHIGGIYYEQQHWDARVKGDVPFTLVLRNANGKEVEKKDVKTDEMGKISADFVLPASGLPGFYTVSAMSGRGRSLSSVYVRVEEYKRPTFDVTMDEAQDMQWPQDSITLKGKAMGYNGVPVRGGCVTGTYQFSYPYWWRSHNDSPAMPIDTVQTDDEGHFCVRVPLSQLSEEALWGGLNLQFNVAVLSVAGETREASMSVPLSIKPLRLLLDAPKQQERENLKDINLSLIASTGRPTDGTVDWAIYQACEEKRISEEALLKGTLSSHDKKLTFDLSVLQALPAGQYELYAKATSNGNADSTKAYFILFGMDDTRLPKVTPSWLYCPDNTFGPGKNARIQIGTSFEDVCLYYTIVAKEKVIEERMMRLSDELRVMEIPYDESYGDGATLDYAFVKGGMVYREEQSLRVVKPDKQLKWEWTSFRDRLHPGDKETWTLRLTQPDGKPASAQLMATIYDASLDALASHHWDFSLMCNYQITRLPWAFVDYYSRNFMSEHLLFPMKSYKVPHMVYDAFNFEWYDGMGFGGGMRYAFNASLGETRVQRMMATPMMAKAADTNFMAASAMTDEAVGEDALSVEEEGNAPIGAPIVALRTNFNETAAFLPRLHTNANGEVSISFTLPESLTTWKLLGVAHTSDLLSTTIEAEAVARKEMMARLYLPRFLRTDDHAGLRATIQNLTDKPLSGHAILEIFDPETERVIVSKKLTFKTKANGECLLTFDYTPTDDYPVVAVRLTAKSKTFSDGEQHYLPILPNKTYITESVEISADSMGTFTTDLSTLFNKNSDSATRRMLTVEYTTHPIWYALQALPSLIEPTSKDIISVATALQAQALSTYIANTTPRLQTLVEIWKREQSQGQPALSSRLVQDEELKQIILDDTPWLREAENEADRKARLIQLYDNGRQQQVLSSLVERLEERLQPDGGFAWFPGMASSEVMTRIVATELSRLLVMTHDCETLPTSVKQKVKDILTKNIGFIAEKTAERVAEMKKGKEPINTSSPLFMDYIYTVQHAGVKLTPSQEKDVRYLLDNMKGSVANMNNWERAMAAIIMKGAGRMGEARKYYESLLEHTTTNAERGTFFDYAGGSFNPTSHKIIHHVAAMEAVHEMEPNNKDLRRNLRRWLLQQKRTQMWESNICTSDAIYALLLDNQQGLSAAQSDEIVLNYAKRKVTVSRKEADTSISGLGYVKQQLHDGEAPKSITVTRRTDSEAWGAVFASYLTPMADVEATTNGLTVRQEVSSQTPKVGQRLTTRYVIRADRDYEYVRLRADRAACSEPARLLSGYRYQGGLGYYCSIHDTHTDYFFDSLPKGTYVLEESFFIDRAGVYTTGLVNIQCLYAPEYNGHSPMIELTVSE